MIIDLSALGLLLLFFLRGWTTGFLRQALGLALVVGLYLAAPPVAAILRELVLGQERMAPPAVELVFLGATFLVMWVGLGLVIRSLTKTLHRAARELARWDRRLGGMVGLAKGLLVVYIVLALFVYAQEPAERHAPAFVVQLEESIGVSFARRVNWLNSLYFKGMEELREWLESAEAQPLPEGLRRFATVQRQQVEDDLEGVLLDPRIRRAVEERDYSTLLADERVRRLMHSAEFREMMSGSSPE